MIILYILLHLLPLFISWLRGIYISAQTARTDYPSASWIWLYKQLKMYNTNIDIAKLHFYVLLENYIETIFGIDVEHYGRL